MIADIARVVGRLYVVVGERVGVVAAWVLEGSVADPRECLAETGEGEDVTRVPGQWHGHAGSLKVNSS